MVFGWDKEETCTICGEKVRNLGLHKYHKHRDLTNKVLDEEVKKLVPQINEIRSQPDDPEPLEELEVNEDEVLSQPLSIVLKELKQILNKFQNHMEIKISEQNGKPFEVQIVTTIKIG